VFDIKVNLKVHEEAILSYEQQPIEKGKILFYGHSLFTRWNGDPKWGNRGVADDIRAKDGTLAIVNHGFGGSNSEEQLYYYPRMVRPWEPKALVYASLCNDGMYGLSVEETMTNVTKLLHWARTDFPGIKLYLVQVHPMPKYNESTLPDNCNRIYHRNEKYNNMLDVYEKYHPDTKIIRLWDDPRLFQTPEDVGDPHKVREDLFVADQVHPNQAGYDILGDIFRKALDEVL